MPGRGTPTVAMRVPQALWDRFGEMAEPNRTAALIAFMRWYLREPGAKLPQRPAESHGEPRSSL